MFTYGGDSPGGSRCFGNTLRLGVLWLWSFAAVFVSDASRPHHTIHDGAYPIQPRFHVEPAQRRWIVSFFPGNSTEGKEKAVLAVPGVTSVESLGLRRLEMSTVLIASEVDEAKVAETIRVLPSVEYFEQDMILHGDSRPGSAFPALNDPGAYMQASLRQINVAEAWKTTTGSRAVIVCIVDTGIDADHEDLQANMWVNEGEIPGNGLDDDGNGFVDDVHGYDFHNDDADPTDDHSHGTHIAGIIGASANNTKGIVGVSPVVSLMACKALDENLAGLMSNSVKCLDYCLNNGAEIMTFSGGTFDDSRSISAAIDDVGQAGKLVVASAGNTRNNNDARPYYPACYKNNNLITVASIDSDDKLSAWSNYGKRCVDIAAPGDGIVSTFPLELICPGGRRCDAIPYRFQWGTSQVLHA